ncbi:Protein Phosphatase 1 Regulatory Subunit 3B [Manis pentadactyla]|nr:Protein Phosphatase 1 Regulatory Subunit 3B [Manis pentadactyla]
MFFLKRLIVLQMVKMKQANTMAHKGQQSSKTSSVKPGLGPILLTHRGTKPATFACGIRTKRLLATLDILHILIEEPSQFLREGVAGSQRNNFLKISSQSGAPKH